MNIAPRTRTAAALSALLATAFTVSACGLQQPMASSSSPTARTTPQTTVRDPLVITYDGGLHVLDGQSLHLVADIPLPGFNRVNPAGDDRHVLVSTSTGFRILDAAAPELTSDEFTAAEPGHVVRHAGRTTLFSDGTGKVVVFDPRRLGDGLPETEVYTADTPHHGVAVGLGSGELVVTLGTEEKRVGILVLDKDGREIARNENCPGVHGEATARDDAVVIGCQDGVLLYRDGEIRKIESPHEYGRIGNQAGSDRSAIVLGDYKKDPAAELERPRQISLIDTKSGTLKLLDLPTSYTFRSLARGPGGEALVLGTDGALHVIDPDRAETVSTIKVLDPWKEPVEWQKPRPMLFVRGRTAYVTDPSTRELHSIDLGTGRILRTVPLPKTPNELTGVTR
ncbi:zinc metallochaperone AztD [Rhizohabitans arisaemae]|uniref:zinc metallochaperone AztD n=1 Tax=Rhizohabitans arisaemae TaxID=2720610 RepID=UPI0024B193F4|nr:zinc metallochaperone AztD [Rhizohabitans arisaemae]